MPKRITRQKPILSRKGEVRLVKDCMICHREVVLRAIRDSNLPMPPDGAILPEICADCKRSFLSTGVALINPNTGSLVVIKDEVFKIIFPRERIPLRKVLWADEEIIDAVRDIMTEAGIESQVKFEEEEKTGGERYS